MTLMGKFKILSVLFTFWNTIKGFLDNPLVIRFIDHVTEQTSWTSIDDEVWNAVKRAMSLNVDEVPEFLGNELGKIQKAYEVPDNGFVRVDSSMPDDLVA